MAKRLRLTAVELAPRPPDLPAEIRWMDRPPTGTTGLLVATEWLDNVPVDVAIGNPPRYLHVNGRPGGQVTRRDESWLRAWWPQSSVEGARAEIGSTRDRAWASAVSCVERGLALAVDYGHGRDARPVFGTLAGHRHGRRVEPVPDGSCDITAYVAIDSVAAAGSAVAGTAPLVVNQRAALHALGVHGRRPPVNQAREDPVGYVQALARATAAAELTDPDGLGGHWWLLQPVGISVIPEVISLA
jgi:SAM-dependent MidA family methyltransferase